MNTDDMIMLAQCINCGERFEKKSIEDKGTHICAPKSSETPTEES